MARAAVDRGETLKATCVIEGESYRVTLRNDGHAPRKYWIFPLDEKHPAFRRVPMGASYFTRRPDETEAQGSSSLVVVSDAIRLPVVMAELKPREVVVFGFELNALWGIWLQANDPKLKEQRTQFRIVVNVYLDEHLQRSLKAESEWTDF